MVLKSTVTELNSILGGKVLKQIIKDSYNYIKHIHSIKHIFCSTVNKLT